MKIWRAQGPLGWGQIGELTPHLPGGWRLPLSGRVSAEAQPGRHGARPPERLPTLCWAHFLLPSPSPSGCCSHSIYYCSCSASPPLSLGRACSLSAWQEPAVSLAGASIAPYLGLDNLCQGQTTQGASQGCPSPHPAPFPHTASHSRGSSSLWLITPALQGLHPGKGGGQSEDPWSGEKPER